MKKTLTRIRNLRVNCKRHSLIGVSIDYLVSGFDIEQDSLSAREVELITSFRKMSDRGKKIILENAELLAEG